jgi:hypothetical protein
MSDFKLPAKNPASPFAGWRGHHVGVRVKTLNERNWYVEKLDFRVVHEWPYADEQLAYIAPPNDDAFLVELLGGGNPPPAITTSASTCRISRRPSPISEPAVSRS